jgi:hypothetical protein
MAAVRLSFPAYRRKANVMLLSVLNPARNGPRQIATIDPLERQAAQAQDARGS